MHEYSGLLGLGRIDVTAGALLVLAGAVSNAQSVVSRNLRAVDLRLEEEFTAIGSVRELRDGRVLIVDPEENRCVVANLRSGAVTAVGRVGSGPKEFRRVGTLFALRDDSTLLTDPGNRRWLLLDGTNIVGSVSAKDGALTLGRLRGTDTSGHVLAEKYPPRNWNNADAATESVYVVRGDRVNGRGDSVARTLSHPVKIENSASGRGAPRVFEQPLSAAEQAVMFGDGWVAVVRLNPYRIDVIPPRGATIRGKALPDPMVRVDAAEKRAHMERMSRKTGGVVRDASYFPVWPPTASPFRDDALVVGPAGQLFILKMQTLASPGTRYDIVDRLARLVGTMTLPENQRIVGFGKRAVYVAVTDSVGIQRLVRHPWP